MVMMMMVEGLRGAFKGSKIEMSTSKKRLKDGNGDFILSGIFSCKWHKFGTDNYILILYKRKIVGNKLLMNFLFFRIEI